MCYALLNRQICALVNGRANALFVGQSGAPMDGLVVTPPDSSLEHSGD